MKFNKNPCFIFVPMDGPAIIHLDTCWVLTMFEKVAKKAQVTNKSQ